MVFGGVQLQRYEAGAAVRCMSERDNERLTSIDRQQRTGVMTASGDGSELRYLKPTPIAPDVGSQQRMSITYQTTYRARGMRITFSCRCVMPIIRR